MKNQIKKIVFLFLFVFAAQSLFAKEVTKYVSINNGVLREKDSATSKKLCKVEYAEAVIVVSEKGSWSYVQKVSDASKKGWISTSALSKKKIVAKSNVSANAKEIALAGKGLNKGMEAYMGRDYSYDYTLVDKVENVGISDADIVSFMKEGKLKVGE